MPTASAVVSDLVDIARNILKGISRRVPARARSEETMEDIRLMPMEEIVTKYYFRFSAVDGLGSCPTFPVSSERTTSASPR